MRHTTGWTKEQITEKVLNDLRWLERAILAIYRLQTIEEQQAECTKLDNRVGFNAADARRMSCYAKWLLAGKHLTGPHVDRARRAIVKYAKQLEIIANAC